MKQRMNKRGRVENLRKNGNPGNSGGGRPPNWLKEKCKSIVDDLKLAEFLGECASGKNVEKKLVGDQICMMPADVKDRVHATEILMDRGWGRPTQEVVRMNFVFEFVGKITDVLSRILPQKCPHCRRALNVKEAAIMELEVLSREIDLEKIAS